SALPLVLASLHERMGGGLVVLLPEDADARDAAESAAWFLGDDAVGLLPSRGVTLESGLAPPPHLVGERARALHVLERGGLVCAFSPFTQRALHPVAVATLYPATERRLDLVEPELAGDEDGEAIVEVPDDLVPALDGPPDIVFQPDDVRRVWEDDGVLEPPS